MSKYTQLQVWVRARELLLLISSATAGMRPHAQLKLHLRQAAMALVENITEGAERTDQDFCRFLTTALNSCAEVEAQILMAGDLGLLAPGIVAQVLDITAHIEQMIRHLMSALQPSG